METWFGRVSVYWQDNAKDKLVVHGAVYCQSREEFESLFRTHVSANGYHIIEFEIVVPANEWLRTYGYANDVLSLIDKISEYQRVVTSDIVGEILDKSKETIKYLEIVNHQIPVLENDSDSASWEKAWIVPELKQRLFGQSSKQIVNTYLIVDAYLRKQISGVFDLVDNYWDVNIKCLFKGKSADKLKEVSPYLIDMTLTGDSLNDDNQVSKFHKDFFTNHWGKQTGIFIRTTASMDEVWAHFRRFTRVQMQEQEEKMWVYFRFWQPNIAQSYLTGLATLPEKIATWGRINEEDQITHWIAETGEDKIWDIQPIWTHLSDYPFSKKALLISISETQSLEQKKIEEFEQRAAQELFGIYSDSGKTLEQFKQMVGAVRQWAEQLGIESERDVTRLSHLALILGYRFVEDARFEPLNNMLCDNSISSAHRVNQYFSGIELWMVEVWDKEQEGVEQRLTQLIASLLQGHGNTIVDTVYLLMPSYRRGNVESQLNEFISQCQMYCNELAIESRYACHCYVLIALLLGQYFISDPMHRRLKQVFEASGGDEVLKEKLCQFFNEGVDYVENI